MNSHVGKQNRCMRFPIIEELIERTGNNLVVLVHDETTALESYFIPHLIELSVLSVVDDVNRKIGMTVQSNVSVMNHLRVEIHIKQLAKLHCFLLVGVFVWYTLRDKRTRCQETTGIVGVEGFEPPSPKRRIYSPLSH